MNNQDQQNLLVSRTLVEPGISDIMHQLSEKRPEVFRHSLNVAYLVAEICYSELSKELYHDNIINKMDCIRGALLHDIGKLDIQKDILHKTTKLTSNEVLILMEHTQLGYKKLFDIEEKYKKENVKFSNVVKDIVLHHHENSDGTGYPNNICVIPIETRLVAICDKYDAMTEDRPYRPAKSKYNAYQILSKSNLDKELFLLLVSCDSR